MFAIALDISGFADKVAKIMSLSRGHGTPRELHIRSRTGNTEQPNIADFTAHNFKQKKRTHWNRRVVVAMFAAVVVLLILLPLLLLPLFAGC